MKDDRGVVWPGTGDTHAQFHRLRALDEEFRDHLAQRWTAHCARKGPTVATNNVDKLRDLVEIAGGSEEFQGRLQALEHVARASWTFETGPLERIASLHEEYANGMELDLVAVHADLRSALLDLQSKIATALSVLETADWNALLPLNAKRDDQTT
jgi:hypothetical protein